MSDQHQNNIEQIVKEDREDERPSWRPSMLLMVLIALVVIVTVTAIGYGQAYGWGVLWDDIQEHWWGVLVHALLTAVIGGLLIHQIIKTDEINEIKKALRDTLLADPVIVERLSKKQKSDTIERLIRSIVPGDLGDLFFKAMVKPYLDK